MLGGLGAQELAGAQVTEEVPVQAVLFSPEAGGWPGRLAHARETGADVFGRSVTAAGTGAKIVPLLVLRSLTARRLALCLLLCTGFYIFHVDFDLVGI